MGCSPQIFYTFLYCPNCDAYILHWKSNSSICFWFHCIFQNKSPLHWQSKSPGCKQRKLTLVDLTFTKRIWGFTDRIPDWGLWSLEQWLEANSRAGQSGYPSCQRHQALGLLCQPSWPWTRQLCQTNSSCHHPQERLTMIPVSLHPQLSNRGLWVCLSGGGQVTCLPSCSRDPGGANET